MQMSRPTPIYATRFKMSCLLAVCFSALWPYPSGSPESFYNRQCWLNGPRRHVLMRFVRKAEGAHGQKALFITADLEIIHQSWVARDEHAMYVCEGHMPLPSWKNWHTHTLWLWHCKLPFWGQQRTDPAIDDFAKPENMCRECALAFIFQLSHKA